MEYNELRSDEERAVWLKQHTIFRSFKKGKEFLEKNLPVEAEAYDYRTEASTEAQAAC